MTHYRKGLSWAGFTTMAVLLGACAGNGDNEEYVERPVNDLYSEAVQELENGYPSRAAAAFQEVERQHPYSQWATRGQVMAVYSFYDASEYDQAIDAARRFISLHPGHKDVPYVYYMIGRSHYDQISDIGRDQKQTQLAHNAFQELIRRFPSSDFSRDAKLKSELAEDHLAGKEMEIGRYYQRTGKFVAAANRFQTVVDQYQTTTQIEEALHRLTETYLALGIRDDAIRSAAVLGHNYPSSPWYQDSYALLTDVDDLPLPSPAEGDTEAGASPLEGSEGGELIEPPVDAQAGPS